MSQNTSSAVMAQRKEPHDALDFFPTPLWATRALIEKILANHGWSPGDLLRMTAFDPACGEGHMARPLAEYFKAIYASDIHEYGFGDVDDFLLPGKPRKKVDWVITNPPFILAKEFIFEAMSFARCGVAMLVRTSFLEGMDRYRTLFGVCKPCIVAPFVERVIMHKGILRDPSVKYWCEKARKMKSPSTATSYAWIIWRTDGMSTNADTLCVWIPPCRKQLERPGDYDIPGNKD